MSGANPVRSKRSLCIWPNDIWCESHQLEEYLTFMSDDFLRVRVFIRDDFEDVPTYDEAVRIVRARERKSASQSRRTRKAAKPASLAEQLGVKPAW